MDTFVVCAVGILAAMAGFWLGRSLQWQIEETEREPRTKTILQGREIAAPTAGTVSVTEENGKKQLRILPEQGKVYAPAAGRIKKLYPMGQAMLLQTEYGAEILLQVGDRVDDMYSVYYRCRVMEHEYVRKGSLLLEFDPAGIEQEGASAEIRISVENAQAFDSVTVSEQGALRAGEPLLYVAKGDRPQEAGELLEPRERIQPFW